MPDYVELLVNVSQVGGVLVFIILTCAAVVVDVLS